ncbi:MAG: hypothetical protein U9Q75_04470, partial [Pseudomonadota bacterium]|nr:hypothetical protein [Pseudomonadota bacterium]
PAIETASNEECLACHQEIMERRPLAETPAGVKTEDTLAWYQTDSTYQGEQETFHRRHLASESARSLMNLKCNTCHQGHNSNKEVSSPSHLQYSSPAMLKEVDPEICLMCHGAFDYQIMLGMAMSWEESRDVFNNDCMVCHTLFRTNAHNVNYLNQEAIAQAGAENGDVCYGCHGGRSWYRIPYPYARNSWPGMPLIVPDWASERPTASQPRFLVGMEEKSAPAAKK